MKGWRRTFHANEPLKKAGVVILISYKLDFKLKNVVRDTEGLYIILKGAIHQDDLTIVNIYAPNMGAANYLRKLLIKIKTHIDMNTLIIGDLNMPLSEIDRSLKQKINKETRALNDTLDQMDLIDIYRTFHSKTTEYSFFSSAHGTFSRIYHIQGQGHKSGLNRYQN